MSRTGLVASFAFILAAGTAQAEVPRVTVDTAPAHSLVARVMDGLGTPDLIVPPGASPHDHALRPSGAAALQDADLVFWIGPDLTPWLAEALGTLAPEAEATALLDLPGTRILPLREGALFEDRNHADRHDQDHDAAGSDPHAWLSPANAAIWLDAIAVRLAGADPANTKAYAANAAAGRAELDALTAEIEALLDPVRGGRFVVFHDAYQYFEDAFDIPASGALSLGDASPPSPGRIAAIRDRIAAERIACVLAEPQFDPRLVATVMDGTDAATGLLDPLGSGLEPGPALHPQLLRDLAAALAGCL